MNPSTRRVACIQHRCSADRDENLQRSLSGIAEAAVQGAKLVLLPELHRSRYFCQTADPELFDLAEAIDGPTCQALSAAAKKHGVVIVGSIFERRLPGLYHNTAIVLERDGSLAGHYRKMHIPDDPGYYEKYYFSPGDTEPGFTPIETSVGKLGVLICWDQWFPEAARSMALAGAELLLYPTAIGWESAPPSKGVVSKGSESIDPVYPGPLANSTDQSTLTPLNALNTAEDENQRQLESWQIIQRSHAVANALPVLVANRCGHEPDPSAQSAGQDFWGHSMIVEAGGRVVAQSAAEAEQVLIANVDLSLTEQQRRIWPFLRDRRVDAYRHKP